MYAPAEALISYITHTHTHCIYTVLYINTHQIRAGKMAPMCMTGRRFGVLCVCACILLCWLTFLTSELRLGSAITS